MVSAAMCKVHTLANIERYCSKNIEPLLLEANGQAIDFGKYNEDGTVEYYISKVYAKDRPTLEPCRHVPVSPFIIKTFLEAYGYTVEWLQIQQYYPAGYSGSGRTKYYDSGYHVYYTLRISC